MKSGIALILLFNLLIINSAQAADAGAQRCQAALSKRQYAQAIQQAEQSPAQANAWLCKGRAQAALQQPEAAQKSFEQAIALKPTGLDLASAYLLLGNAQQTQQRTEAALASYQQAMEVAKAEKINRYVMVTYNLMGEARMAAKQPAQALADFQAGEKLAMNDNERADSYEHEAEAYHAMQQLDKAVEYQLKAVLMQQRAGTPDQYAEASLKLGQWFTEQKDYQGAEKTYQRLTQYAKDKGGEYYEAKTALYWAQTKQAQGDAAGAEQLIKQAQTIAVKYKDPELDALVKQVQAK